MSIIRTVGELQDYIRELPRDFHVILQSDAEGNDCDTLSRASVVLYDPSGEHQLCDCIYDIPSPEVELFEDEIAPENAVRVLLLSP